MASDPAITSEYNDDEAMLVGRAGSEGAGFEGSWRNRLGEPRQSPRAVAMLAFVAVGCARPAATRPNPPPADVVASPEAARAAAPEAPVAAAPRNSCANYDAHVETPRIDLHEPTLTARVAATVGQRIEQLRQSLEDTVADACDAGIPPDTSPSVSIQCEVAFASAKLISIGCVGDLYAGGAHPTKTSMTMTFELPALREVRLEDVFVPGKPWRKALDRLCAAAFARQLGGDDEDPGYPDGCPTLESFAVTAAGLRFYFEDSLPFVIGSVHPLVTWLDLGSYVRHDRVASWLRAAY